MEITKLNVSSDEINRTVQDNFIGYDINLYSSPDYHKWVIKLVPVDEGEYKFVYADVLFARDNSIYSPTNVILNMAKIWSNPICRCNNLVISNANDSRSLCTFMCKGKKYYGIHWFGAANPTIRIVRVKINNVPIEEILYEDSTGTVNAEVSQSVVNINWDGSPKI